MSVREIKASIALDGEKAFKAALDDASRGLRVMNADLKAATSEFERTGDGQQFLSQKSRILSDEIAQQEKIVDSLVNAVRDSGAQYGETSRQTDGYRIKLSNATATLNKMKKQLEETEREARDFGRTSSDVGKQISDGIGDGSEEASGSLDGLLSKVQSDIATIKGSATFTVASQVVQTISGAVNSVTQFVDSNREYRRDMSMLQQAADDAGVPFADVQKMTISIASLTGDMDGAREGMANLLNSGLGSIEGDYLNMAITLLEGASIRWNDTLKFENLSESLQETVASGKATGAYGELIERLGLNIDTFNEAMEGQSSNEERMKVALTWISGQGLDVSKWSYADKNNDLIEATQAKMELADSWAALAEELEPIVTSLTQGVKEVVDGLTQAVRDIKTWVQENAPKAAKALQGLHDGSAIAAVLGDEEPSTETKQAIRGTAATRAGVVTGSRMNAWGALTDILNSTGGASAGEETAEAAVDAAKETLDDNAATLDLAAIYNTSGLDEVLRTIRENTFTDAEKQQWVDQFSKLGIDLRLAFGLDDVADDAHTAGSNLSVELGNGINQSASHATNAAASLVNSMNSIMAQLRMPGIGFSGGSIAGGPLGSGQGGGGQTIALQLDGRTLGKVAAPYINEAMGTAALRAGTIG